MTVHSNLFRFRTSDGERLHGLHFKPSTPEDNFNLAVLMVHGVALNFYTGPLPVFAQGLAERGHHVFTINTRGHDWVSRGGDGTAFCGATYENLEDCLLDLDGALSWLGTQGFQRYVLMGHSLGCIKSLLYQGTRKRVDVVGVISCSAPRQYYSARASDQPKFPQRMAKAEKLLGEGRGEEFLWAETGDSQGLFSARTYVSKYGSHEKNDIRPHAARLGCPLLTLAGGMEHPNFPAYARELAESAGPNRGMYRLIEGANHSYHRREGQVIEIISNWLKGIDGHDS